MMYLCSEIAKKKMAKDLTTSEISRQNILNNPVAAAEAYAKENRVILLLKGPATVITDGETTYLTDTGCAGMATAGSGDVLSGILAAVLAYMPDPLYGTAAAAWINGKAGETAQRRMGSVSMTAGDTANCVAEVIRQISSGQTNL